MEPFYLDEDRFEDIRLDYESIAVDNQNKASSLSPQLSAELSLYGVKLNRVSDTEITGITAKNDIFVLKRTKRTPFDDGKLSYSLRVRGYLVFSSGTLNHALRYITKNKPN